MITQEQYDQLNEGETVTVRYVSQYTAEQFEVTGKIYMFGKKRLGGWVLEPQFSDEWTIIEHIPATPAWHSAHVISASREGDDERRIYVRHHPELWLGPDALLHFAQTLQDVKILVGKDVEL
jgi:hypothetical protein